MIYDFPQEASRDPKIETCRERRHHGTGPFWSTEPEGATGRGERVGVVTRSKVVLGGKYGLGPLR